MNADREDGSESAEDWLGREGFDLSALTNLASAPAPAKNHDFIPDLDSYDHIVVGFSSGKDSVACLYLTRRIKTPAPKGKGADREVCPFPR